IAGQTIVVLLVTVVYAAVFHVHTDQDHDGPKTFLHIHLPGIDVHHRAQTSVEANHSDYVALDFLMGASLQNVPDLGTVPGTGGVLAPVRVCCGFVWFAPLRTHAPPTALERIPRSPPASTAIPALA